MIYVLDIVVGFNMKSYVVPCLLRHQAPKSSFSLPLRINAHQLYHDVRNQRLSDGVLRETR
jgi:hypothetical protein